MSSYIPVEFIDEEEFLAIELAIEEAAKKLKRCETADHHCPSKDVVSEARTTDSLCFTENLNADLDRISSKISSPVPSETFDVNYRCRKYGDFDVTYTSEKLQGPIESRNNEALDQKSLNVETKQGKSLGPGKNSNDKTKNNVAYDGKFHVDDSSSDSDWLNDWPCPSVKKDIVEKHKKSVALSTEDLGENDYNNHLVLSETEDQMQIIDCSIDLVSSDAEDASDTDDRTKRLTFSEVDSETDDQGSKRLTLSEYNDNKQFSRDNSVNARWLPSWQSANRNHGQEVKNTTVSKRPKRVTRSDDAREVRGSTKYQNENNPAEEKSNLQWGYEPPARKAPVVKPKCELPSFHFKGHVICCNRFADAERAASDLLRKLEAKKATSPDGTVPLGFDTEWKVVFKRGAARRKVALLQLCMDSVSCHLFQVIHSGITPSLKTILADPLIEKVGVGAFGDASKLSSDYNVAVEGVKDISTLANFKLKGSNEGHVRNKSWSLTSLCQKLLGKQVEKTGKVRCGNWEKYKLSAAQIKYGATDAFASLYLYQVLLTFPDPKEE